MANQFVSIASVLRAGVTDSDGNMTREAQQKFIEWDKKLNGTIDTLGQIQAAITKLGANVIVAGRTGTLQSGIANLSAVGVLNSLTNVADTSTDHLTDGTGTPLAGGKRGAIALDTNNRLATSFNANAVDISSVPVTATSQLSNTGTATVITIAAGTYQFGSGQVSYNSGSVDPGAYGVYYVYFDDPTFAGGAVTFQSSLNPVDTASARGRILVGKITTSGGSGGTNGGGHTGGGSGGRGYNPL